jgi:hypothetical protein
VTAGASAEVMGLELMLKAVGRGRFLQRLCVS